MPKAMIFAAGLGKRLMPLTTDKPKALVEVAGKPMLHWVVEKLVNSGFKQIVINTHHYAEKMREAIEKLPYDAEFIISDEKKELLDTGGGLLKAKEFLQGEEPFIVHNVDVFSDLDLKQLWDFHIKNKAIATLATTNRKSTRYFLWHNNQLAGWENISTNEKIMTRNISENFERKAFSGIQVLSPEVFDHINFSGKFSIKKVYFNLAEQKNILSFNHNSDFWFDLGTIEKIKTAEKMIKEKDFLNY